jgi:WD40 repeat protein
MFDPYHKWLGIHPEHRPPTYYQLLGISPEEHDREVIEEAAIRQTAHVRTYQLGPHAAECTRILNEIAQARTTLLNPAKRKDYDAHLAANTGKKTSQPPMPLTGAQAGQVMARPAPRRRASTAPVTAVTPVAAVEGDLAPLVEMPIAPSRSAVRRPAAPKWPWFVALGGGGFLVLIAAGALLAYALLGNKPKGSTSAEDDGGKSAPPDQVAETRPVTPKPKPIPDPAHVPDPDPRPNPRPQPDPGPRPDPQPPPGPQPRPDPAPPVPPAETVREVGRLEGHANGVTSLAFSPDGRYLLSVVGIDLCLWDVPARQLVQRFEGHQSPIHKVVFSADGRYALTGSGTGRFVDGKFKPMDCTLRLWDVGQRKLVKRFDGHEAPVMAVAFSPDGRRCLSGGGTVISQDGKPVPVDCSVRLWQVSNGKLLRSFEGMAWPVKDVAFGPDERVCASNLLTTIIWEGQTGKRVSTATFPSPMAQSRFTAAGRRLVAFCGDYRVRLWALDTWKEEGPAIQHQNKSMPLCLALSPDGRRALAGFGHQEMRDGNWVACDCYAQLLDLDGRREVARLEGHTGLIMSAAVSSRGYAATGSLDRTIRLWDVRKYVHPAPDRPPEVVGKPPEPKKAPVPDEAKQAEAEKLIKDLFKEEYAKRKPAERLALAAQLLDKAKESEDDPIARFVLLREARDLAAQGGDAAAVLTAIDELARGYAVDAFGMKVTALAVTARNANTPAANKVLAESYLVLSNEAVATDDFDAALHLVALADAAAHKTTHVALVTQVQTRDKEVKEIQKESRTAKEAMATLEKKPEDPEANQTAGHYLCLRKGEWDKGLPLLARGGDAGLQAAAKKDLVKPQEAAAQVEVGDSWWDLGESRKDSTRKALLARAGHWYREALPELTGLRLAKVEGRLKSIAEQGPAPHPTEADGELCRLSGHTDRVTSVSISRDGRRVLSGSADGTVRLWDVETGKELARMPGVSGAVTSVALSSDGRLALASGSSGLWLWDAKDARQITHVPGRRYEGIVISADSQHVLTYSLPIEIISWTRGEGEGFGRSHSESNSRWGQLGCAAVSPDGSLILLAVADGTVRLLHWATHKEVGRLRNTGLVLSLAQSTDGRKIATGGVDKMIRLWDAITGQELRIFKGHRNRVTHVAFSDNGRLLLSGSDDKTVRLWDVRTGRELQSFALHTGKVTSVAISADGRRAVSGSDDKSVRVWALPR